MLPPEVIESLKMFLREDLRSGDITTQVLGPLNADAVATVIAGSKTIIAGIEEAIAIAKINNLEYEQMAFEGNWMSPGDIVLRIKGPAKTLLSVERVILNIMMRMSGIATKTYKMVESARRVNPHVRIAATRKTTPGFRFFEKRAVVVGGGDPHRYALDDMVLIKNNHIAAVGSVGKAVRTAKDHISFSKKISCEVRSLEEAEEAINAGADIVLLDNFTPEEMLKVVETLTEKGLRDHVILEASGGIDENNVQQYAQTGVDIISSGAVTHSYESADLKMRLSLV